MGHASQRRRSGGGITPLNHILQATIAGADSANIEYAAPVDASQLIPSSFTSNLSGETGISANNVATRRIILSFTGSIVTDTELLYEGATPGIVTPQTIDYA